MAEKSEQRSINLERMRRFLQDIYEYPIDEGTADRYGQIKGQIFERFGPKEKRARRRIRLEELGFNENDLWIAAVALQHNLTLVSSDSDFKRIQEVSYFPLEDWSMLSSS